PRPSQNRKCDRHRSSQQHQPNRGRFRHSGEVKSGKQCLASPEPGRRVNATVERRCTVEEPGLPKYKQPWPGRQGLIVEYIHEQISLRRVIREWRLERYMNVIFFAEAAAGARAALEEMQGAKKHN